MEKQIRLGESLFAQGRTEEAERCFVEITKSAPENSEAYNNLGVIAFERNHLGQALDYFTEALKRNPFDKNAIINCASLLRTLNRVHEITPLLERAAEKFPHDQELLFLLHESREDKQIKSKIAVVCLPGLQSFLGDIVDFLRTKYQVRTCYTDRKQEIDAAIEWADIVWLEWANELAVGLTNPSTCLDGKRVLCRLHSYEAFAGYTRQIRWEKISDLVFVAKHIQEIVLRQVPDLPDRVPRIHLVPNGVNLQRFPFKNRPKGFDLAYLGHINYKKGPMLLLHAFRELVAADQRYRLHIAGNFQDARYELYFSQMIQEMKLQENVRMAGWIDNVPAWLEDKQYIVCTSVLEGHPVGIMEAMACGLKPIIHNYVGARQSYPEKYLWNTIPEFVRMVTEDGYDSMEYRSYIEGSFALAAQLEQIQLVMDLKAPACTRTGS